MKQLCNRLCRHKYHSLCSSAPRLFRFDDMAQPRFERVLVKLQKNGDSSFKNAHFTQCLVAALSAQNDACITQCNVEMRDTHLHISAPSSGKSAIKMKHPSFCPVHNMQSTNYSSLPEDVYTRGVDCGAAIILEAGDGRVLLTRRGDNLRTFPGIWVPPGGHIEQNESFAEAGLRELREETGLDISEHMCVQPVQALAVWESVYPPKLSLGPPVRHHAVIYLHAKLKPEYTSTQLYPNIQMDPSEVGACAWFSRSMAKVIVSAREEDAGSLVLEHSVESFSALVLNAALGQCEVTLPFSDLLQTAGDDKDKRGRVSTGTKFALEEWLSLT
ncbi:nucleoside diphosphate-linked moiety X motif 17-like isoform X2 [Dreissena polymorpha]|uniref:nucleoside diphosphate-linked moiety X motif 17-like isoform X2 n=1 Tax=Dreissena polymorpha TaxID=45954 RepID=UPI002263D2C1|nr:nucleoside diphosphate-linked moiety X motif 17-like isoform X2 [Dreissena polymorpha]